MASDRSNSTGGGARGPARLIGSAPSLACVLLLLAGLASSPVAFAAPDGGGPGIYTCFDQNNRRLTSDRPIPECVNREQRVLNRDGSVQRVIPPTLTAEERAEQDAREQRRLAERRAQQDLIRRDRGLLQRFPNEAMHHRMRVDALNDVRAALARSEQRLAALAAERKPLIDETEFYVGRSLPPRLKQQLDANDAAVEAQRVLLYNQQLEIARINATFDAELARLRKLWAGAAPGSLGPLETAGTTPAPATP